MTDMAVVREAYATAKGAGASDFVLLALFEAGVVESNFTNAKVATDHDSLGYLQQRPSQGWPDPTNVATATKSFLAKAMKLEPQYASRTAGQLAQAVQVSAFPGRYDLAYGKAMTLIKAMDSGFTGASADTGASGGSGGIPGLSELIGLIKALADPKTWTRVLMFLTGIVLIVIGIMKLTGDNKLSDTTKKIVKTAATVAVIPK